MALATETKVGILVLAAAAGFGWLTLQSGTLLGGFGTGSSTRELSSAFTDVEGLNVGSPVKIAGVTVGEVTDITLMPTGVAIVEFKVNDEVPLPASVTAQVATSGLIGEKYLALISGVAAGTTPDQIPMLAGDVARIPSSGAVAPENMAQNFAKVSSDLESITGALRSALGGPEGAEKLNTIINGLAAFSADLERDGGTIVADMKASMESLRTILGGNEARTGQMIANFSETAENLAAITARLERGEGLLGQMMQDGEGNQMMADLTQTLADVRAVAAKLNSGEGTLGRLISDEELGDKLADAVDTIGAATERVEALRTEVDLQAYTMLAEEAGKGEFNVTLRPRPTRYYALGVVSDGFATAAEDTTDPFNPYFGKEFGDEVKFTAQFGHVFEGALAGHNLGLRVGLKESTGGVGLDTRLPVPLLNRDADLSADLYDFSGSHSAGADNPHLTLKARMGLLSDNDSLYGILGYDNMLNQEYASPFVGVGFRFQDDDLKYLVGSSL